MGSINSALTVPAAVSGAKLEGLALRRNDVWAWDIVHDRYHDNELPRCLTMKDEATGYCLAIEVGRHLHSAYIRALLRRLITRYGCPRAIRSDNGGEVVAMILREEMQRRGPSVPLVCSLASLPSK